jgi:hypothetical protein
MQIANLLEALPIMNVEKAHRRIVFLFRETPNSFYAITLASRAYEKYSGPYFTMKRSAITANRSSRQSRSSTDMSDGAPLSP